MASVRASENSLLELLLTDRGRALIEGKLKKHYASAINASPTCNYSSMKQ